MFFLDFVLDFFLFSIAYLYLIVHYYIVFLLNYSDRKETCRGEHKMKDIDLTYDFYVYLYLIPVLHCILFEIRKKRLGDHKIYL